MLAEDVTKDDIGKTVRVISSEWLNDIYKAHDGNHYGAVQRYIGKTVVMCINNKFFDGDSWTFCRFFSDNCSAEIEFVNDAAIKSCVKFKKDGYNGADGGYDCLTVSDARVQPNVVPYDIQEATIADKLDNFLN